MSKLLPTTVFVFLHRRAETEIGSDQTQVHSVTEEGGGGLCESMLLILTHIAVVKSIKALGYGVSSHLLKSIYY